ncbi:proprotein convertase P-domain-containing protein [Candidatus Sumerlaeota bacterium]|nr:proprotein convertase P-domain-containing protein [Candidatus Sumerlaeota bacterium]
MLSKKGMCSVVGLIFLSLCLLNLNAEVPQLINYQAKITDSGGNPVNGTYDIVFTIYDAATGGNVIWTETHSDVNINNGSLNVLLGSVTPIPLTTFHNPARWLGVKIGSDPEMTPRQRIVSVGYAFKCHSAEELQVGGDAKSYTSGDTPKTITPGTTAVSTITISDGPTNITNITVDIDVNPVGELMYIRLRSPASTEVTLVGTAWGGSYVLNFDKDQFPESGSMDDFLGENANGSWTLTISTGTGLPTNTVLNSWQLNFNETHFPCEKAYIKKLKANTLAAKDFRMVNSSDQVTAELDGNTAEFKVGGSGAVGKVEVLNSAGNTTLKAQGSSVEIGGTGNACNLWMYNSGGGSTLVLYGSNGSIGTDGYIRMREMTEPSDPPPNYLYLFARDQGGKTQLCVKFSDGTVTVLASEP